MTESEMISAAKEAGFLTPVIINTADIPFKPEFRRYCEENLCGKYGINYSCPPACGSTEDMAAAIKAYKRALVLQTVWEIDYKDGAAVKASKGSHNSHACELRKLFRDNGIDGLLCGASCCTLCSPCAMEQGGECRFMKDRWSCLSAYCVHVEALAGISEMTYWRSDGKVAFFGMYCFD